MSKKNSGKDELKRAEKKKGSILFSATTLVVLVALIGVGLYLDFDSKQVLVEKGTVLVTGTSSGNLFFPLFSFHKKFNCIFLEYI